MAIFVNKNTFEKTIDVNTPDYENNIDYVLYQERVNGELMTYFQYPDCDRKYIKPIIDYPYIAEMTQAEKDAIDEHERLYSTKSKMQILNEIWSYYYEDPEGLNRMIMAINKYPIFALVLEDNSYNTARMIMQMALGQGDITQDDYNNVNSILPLQE